MGATMVSGLAMRWLRDAVFGLERPDAYATMTGWAADVPPGAAGLLFLPYLAGERTPHMNPAARGLFLGLSVEHGRGHLVRAVMEGATLALFDAYDVLRSLGAAPSTIVLSGGGAQSGLWRQIVADVFGLPVLPLLTVEQSALGAALLAGAGIGLFDPAETAQRWATYDDPVEPDARAQAVYERLLPVFRDAYRKHVDDFRMLGDIAAGAV
jgi:xylulokinase